MPHLVCDISYHGYGHLTQTGPVLQALARRVPGLALTLRCAAPREVLAPRIGVAFRHVAEALDVGMVMTSAVDVDREASARAFAEFHSDWEARVEREARRLAELAPDLLLANVPYLSLAAAARAGIPAVALCSLNWADIFAGCVAGMPRAPEIHGQMLDAYRSARHFLRLTPGMAMPGLPKLRAVGPVARSGTNVRDELERRLGLGAGERLVLIALGGLPLRLPVEGWPRFPGLRWLVPQEWGVARADFSAFEPLGVPFIDLLASVDAVVAKPGYGTFTEAACNGTPVLYLRRPGWPEEACLVEWLRQNGRCAEVGRAALERGDFAAALAALLEQEKTPPVAATGAEEAARLLEPLLAG